MPAKSKKQLKYIYYLRNKYKSKEKAPKKYKWVFKKEWGKLKENKAKNVYEYFINRLSLCEALFSNRICVFNFEFFYEHNDIPVINIKYETDKKAEFFSEKQVKFLFNIRNFDFLLQNVLLNKNKNVDLETRFFYYVLYRIFNIKVNFNNTEVKNFLDLLKLNGKNFLDVLTYFVEKNSVADFTIFVNNYDELKTKFNSIIEKLQTVKNVEDLISKGTDKLKEIFDNLLKEENIVFRNIDVSELKNKIQNEINKKKEELKKINKQYAQSVEKLKPTLKAVKLRK